MNATITLRDYLGKNKDFIVPNYQRGYVWGKKTEQSKKDKDAVTYILEESLIPGFEHGTEVFIQGITVCEGEEIVLVDGQQRTTFFYLLLKYLGYSERFVLKYKIRSDSEKFLSNESLLKDFTDNPDEEFQDIYFFKKTLRTIHEILSKKLEGKNDKEIATYKSDFLNYLLDKVRFLYINIPSDNAMKVFSMMNGSKAEMRCEEIIKAELLRLASMNNSDFDIKSDYERYAIEWDNNMLRNRYAREWDKWLQWWNREDVKRLFKHSNVMGYLIDSYLRAENQKVLSFDSFKNQFLANQKPIEAKKTFDGLRRLQKRFEDAFNNPKIYNWIGAILRIGNDKDEFIQWYFLKKDKPTEQDLDNYYKCSFLGLTHNEIITHNNLKETDTKNEEDKYDEKFDHLYSALESNNLYFDNPEAAFRLLLRLNIDEDNKQENGKGRKFDFSIWDRNDSRGRSLEHIFPKSKVLHKEKMADGTIAIINGDGVKLEKLPDKSAGYIARASCRCFEGVERIEASEHSIGNLVLLYKDDNSSFNNSSYEEKKSMFFLGPDCVDAKKKQIFKSRHLLHTIYKFAQSSWGGEQIARNKYQTLKDFRAYYGK